MPTERSSQVEKPGRRTPAAQAVSHNVGDEASWLDQNQRAISEALAELKSLLGAHASRTAGNDAKPLPNGGAAVPNPPALAMIAQIFGLSDFERDLLLLCAGVELDASFAALCAGAQGDPARGYPTFSLALAALPNAHWSAITPVAPLRSWRLVELGVQGASLTTTPLRISERALHYLVGINEPDERVASLLEPVVLDRDLPRSHADLSCRLAAALSRPAGSAAISRAQLLGNDPAGARAVAAAACASLRLSVGAISAESLPTAPADIELIARLVSREAALLPAALLIDCHETDFSDTTRAGAIRHFLQLLRGVAILTLREGQKWPLANMLSFEVGRPTPHEQRSLWRAALGQTGIHMNGEIETISSHFDVGAQTIRTACAQALAGETESNGSLEIRLALWEACRSQARPQLESLAQRIVSAPPWNDLVLPEAQKAILRDMAAHVRQRAKVYENWGFGKRGSRGLGISALFAGVSGTGKTLAAEVLARELHLDLYRIDLSSVVSKYIGETEKNLRKVFDAGEEAGAVLLFDEADALFGKRSEVKDSHDRYANIEVSYLLQRMECYKGLAILTTNLKSALDTAFLRRIRFIVQFPFPDASHRAQIWRRIFPDETPREGLDFSRLAQLSIAGGNIRNIALGAAFLAADSGEPIRMAHLLRAAESEYAKIEKPLTDTEIAGWET